MAKREIETIRKTISILDSVDYKRYSGGKANTYLEYAAGAWTDERKLIYPILFPKFLEQILNFKLGETIGTQEKAPQGGDIPDYIPTDTRTHPFVFDCKGMDTFDLSKWYGQIKRYMESHGLRYGILVNMRDLDVYTLESEEEIEALNFSFVELYKDFRENPVGILGKENTKRLLNFVESFSYKRLPREDKIERIAKAKPWTGREELNVKSLTDQLRHIVNILHNDVKQQTSILLNKAEVGRVSEESIAYEIAEILTHISGRESGEMDSETFKRSMNADEATSYGKARDAFFRRVAYFAMTRLLLARVWEDIGFIEQSLYDGGFAKLYENFNRAIRRVLHYAFDLSAEKYPWLFNANNNYSWYEPSDDALIDSLYELSNFYLGKLDQDILGTIYEDYIERVDKKNKGQYYTPREIVSFIWDRVGYDKTRSYFWHIEGKRVPRLIFDPATGSGGFLVEAARRIRECPEFDWNDPQDLRDIWQAILWYIFGSEISSFPYYLTQVNLLIQLTPVIKRILELTGEKPREEPTPLGVLCRDSMELHNPELQLSMQGLEEEKEEPQPKILHFTTAEERIYEKVKSKFAERFSYVCANPPYVSEKGHKELFQATLKRSPYWKNYYQGKMDYLHWFIILGLSKLREWGKLGFITSAYWPTADGASGLREYILENAKIREMILFEKVKIFEHAKGQHSMVFVLTKCSGRDKQQERENNHIKIVAVKCGNQDLGGHTTRENLAFLTKHIQKHVDKSRYEDEYIKVFWSGVKQGELTGKAWHLIRGGEGDRIIEKIQQKGIPLGDIYNINQGIVSGADKVSHKNIRLLPHDIVSHHNIKVGDGIFVLSRDELDSLHLSEDEMLLVKPFYKNSDIDRYYVNERLENPRFVIYTAKDTDIEKYPLIKAHLEKVRPILENRLSVYGEDYPWHKLHRERDERIFEGEKIVTPNRAPQNTFGFSNSPLYAMSDVFFITSTNQSEKLLYILALLNSALMDFWFSKTKKGKGEIREYVGTPLSQIPIRRIDFHNREDVQLHDEIVENVKAIRENMAQLAGYSKCFRGPRLTRLKFEDPLPDMNPEAIVQSLTPENRFSLRTHPEIKITCGSDVQEAKFILNRVGEVSLSLQGAELKVYGKDRKALFINGEEEILKIISRILQEHRGEPWASLREMPFVPQNPEEFEAKKRHILDTVLRLRVEIQQLQNSIDAMVSRLYGVPEGLRRVEASHTHRSRSKKWSRSQ